MPEREKAVLPSGPDARQRANERDTEEVRDDAPAQRNSTDLEPTELASEIDSRSGGCKCGAFRFQVKGEPLRAGLCHCADCRKFSGSAYSFFAVWPKSAFDCTGEFQTFEGRSFCPVCGSRVFSLSDDEAEIMVGSLDSAPSDLLPDYELWVHRRESWLLNSPWAEQFAGDRPDAVSNGLEPAEG